MFQRIAIWFVSVLLISIPIGYLMNGFEMAERTLYETLSHQELIAYLKEDIPESAAEWIAAMLILGSGYLGLVALIAFGLEKLVAIFRKSGDSGD